MPPPPLVSVMAGRGLDSRRGRRHASSRVGSRLSRRSELGVIDAARLKTPLLTEYARAAGAPTPRVVDTLADLGDHRHSTLLHPNLSHSRARTSLGFADTRPGMHKMRELGRISKELQDRGRATPSFVPTSARGAFSEHKTTLSSIKASLSQDGPVQDRKTLLDSISSISFSLGTIAEHLEPEYATVVKESVQALLALGKQVNAHCDRLDGEVRDRSSKITSLRSDLERLRKYSVSVTDSQVFERERNLRHLSRNLIFLLKRKHSRVLQLRANQDQLVESFHGMFAALKQRTEEAETVSSMAKRKERQLEREVTRLTESSSSLERQLREARSTAARLASEVARYREYRGDIFEAEDTGEGETSLQLATELSFSAVCMECRKQLEDESQVNAVTLRNAARDVKLACHLLGLGEKPPALSYGDPLLVFKGTNPDPTKVIAMTRELKRLSQKLDEEGARKLRARARDFYDEMRNLKLTVSSVRMSLATLTARNKELERITDGVVVLNGANNPYARGSGPRLASTFPLSLVLRYPCPHFVTACREVDRNIGDEARALGRFRTILKPHTALETVSIIRHFLNWLVFGPETNLVQIRQLPHKSVSEAFTAYAWHITARDRQALQMSDSAADATRPVQLLLWRFWLSVKELASSNSEIRLFTAFVSDTLSPLAFRIFLTALFFHTKGALPFPAVNDENMFLQYEVPDASQLIDFVYKQISSAIFTPSSGSLHMTAQEREALLLGSADSPFRQYIDVFEFLNRVCADFDRRILRGAVESLLVTVARHSFDDLSALEYVLDHLEVADFETNPELSQKTISALEHPLLPAFSSRIANRIRDTLLLPPVSKIQSQMLLSDPYSFATAVARTFHSLDFLDGVQIYWEVLGRSGGGIMPGPLCAVLGEHPKLLLQPVKVAFPRMYSMVVRVRTQLMVPLLASILQCFHNHQSFKYKHHDAIRELKRTLQALAVAREAENWPQVVFHSVTAMRFTHILVENYRDFESDDVARHEQFMNQTLLDITESFPKSEETVCYGPKADDTEILLERVTADLVEAASWVTM